MYIPIWVIIIIVIYSAFWICGYFVTLFQMADMMIPKSVINRRMKIFAIMGIVEVFVAFVLTFLL